MSGWDDDSDELFGGDEEETDLGEEQVESPNFQNTSGMNSRDFNPARDARSRSEATAGATRTPYQTRPSSIGNGKGRRVKVKPMPVSMATKRPGLASCLLTFDTGKQVLFVKGQ